MDIKIIINNMKEHLEENEDAFKKGAVDSTVCEFGCDELRILLDYITNLQEENERLKQLCNKYEEEHNTAFKLWKQKMGKMPDYEERMKLKKEVDRLNNIINGLEEYIKPYLYMLNGIQGRDIYEQCQLDDFTDIMEKLQELKEGNKDV